MSQNQRFSWNKFHCCAAIRNGLEYQNANGQLRSALNVATLCTSDVWCSNSGET